MCELIDAYLENNWKDSTHYYFCAHYIHKQIWFFSIGSLKYDNVLIYNKITGKFRVPIYNTYYRRTEIEELVKNKSLLDNITIEIDENNIINIESESPNYICMIVFGVDEETLSQMDMYLLTKSATKN